MIRPVLRSAAAALLLTAAYAGAQSPSAPAILTPVAPAVDAKIAALRDAALTSDTYAWDIVEGLTTEVGQRLAGTEAEARARAWSVARLRAMGFANVRVETFAMPVWSRGFESAEIVAPYAQKLVVAALGNSASTGPAGIAAEVIGFDSVDALRRAPDAAVRGKIVFIDHRMTPTQDGSSYGQFGAARRQGPTVASLKGAAGILVRSIGTDSHRNPHTGVQSFSDGAAPIPAGALSNPDADQLVRLFKRNKPISMRLTLVSQVGRGESGNVIAEVPGRDPSLAPLLVSGHLDSWDLGTGALDDGAGVAIAAAAAKRIMDAGRPLRTIRVVWFGAEEVGLFGGLDYLARHGKEPHYAIGESDFGADRVWQVNSKLGPARKTEALALAAALAPLGIAAGSFEEASGSDIGPMIAAGIPAVAMSQDGTRYFDIHHSPDDTLDKIDAAQLRHNVAAWVTMLAVLSGGIAEPKRPRRR